MYRTCIEHVKNMYRTEVLLLQLHCTRRISDYTSGKERLPHHCTRQSVPVQASVGCNPNLNHIVSAG